MFRIVSFRTKAYGHFVGTKIQFQQVMEIVINNRIAFIQRSAETFCCKINKNMALNGRFEYSYIFLNLRYHVKDFNAMQVSDSVTYTIPFGPFGQ